MDIETVRAKMLDQVERAQSSAMLREYRWQFELEDLTAYVTMPHRRRSEQLYLLRIQFDDFPRRAPSYVFVDRESKESVAGAWPPNVRHNNREPGAICTPGTREFHEKLHVNDAQHPWDPERYPVLDTVQRIHKMMEKGIG